MAKETRAEPCALRGANDQAWNVGHHETAFRADAHGAKVRHQGGEGVISHLGPRRRNGANERGFPRVGQAQEAHVGDQFKLKAQIAHFPNRSLGGAPWGPVHRAFKHRVTESVAPPRCDAKGLARLGEIAEGLEGFFVDDRRAHGHLHERILASSPGHLPARARLPCLRSVARLKAKIHERIEGSFGAEDHIAPIAAIPSVGAALSQILRPKERQASVSALARLDANHRLVYELHVAPFSQTTAPRQAKKNPGEPGLFRWLPIPGALGL